MTKFHNCANQYITDIINAISIILLYISIIIIPLSVCLSNSPATKTQKIRH